MIKHYFGKSSKSLFKIKNNFFKQNDNYLIKQSKKSRTSILRRYKFSIEFVR